MLSTLILTVILSLIFSFICSMTEAALYSVPVAYVKLLADSGSPAGKILEKLKADMSVPITAILILNTTANTAGAAIAGFEVAQLYNSTAVGIFSVVFTLLVLYCGELIPKIIGVNFCRPISVFMVYPLNFFVILFKPLILVTGFINRSLKNEETKTVSSEEIQTLTDIGTMEGSLDDLEGEIINNVIELDQTLVRDILTPRVVVFRMDESLSISAIKDVISSWTHTRVPLFNSEEPDYITGYVNQRDVYREIVAGNLDKTLKSLARELKTVPELMRVDKLLIEMLADKEHICAVADEHGGLAGIVTLEDIIEEITGHEIVDEYDTVKDLRRYARLQGLRKSRSQS